MLFPTADAQVKLLEETDCGIIAFSEKVKESGNSPLSATHINVCCRSTLATVATSSADTAMLVPDRTARR